MSTAFITRFHYPEGAEFEWRFEFYRKWTLPTLLGQTDQDFDIAVWCEPWHEDRFRELSPKIRTFQAKHERVARRRFADFTDWANVKGLERYEIQCGLDSDDLVAPDYVKTVHELCCGDESLLVSFIPLLMEIGGRVGTMNNVSAGRTSAFFALYYPGLRGFKFAYCDSHRFLWRYTKRVEIVPAGMCCAVAHGHNDSTIWDECVMKELEQIPGWLKHCVPSGA